MPAIYISTNLDLDGVDLEPLTQAATHTLSSILGRPTNIVMVVVKGSVHITFDGSKAPAAFAELLSLGGIDKTVKRKLISEMGSVLESHLKIPKTRFFCNVIDVNVTRPKL